MGNVGESRRDAEDQFVKASCGAGVGELSENILGFRAPKRKLQPHPPPANAMLPWAIVGAQTAIAVPSRPSPVGRIGRVLQGSKGICRGVAGIYEDMQGRLKLLVMESQMEK